MKLFKNSFNKKSLKKNKLMITICLAGIITNNGIALADNVPLSFIKAVRKSRLEKQKSNTMSFVEAVRTQKQKTGQIKNDNQNISFNTAGFNKNDFYYNSSIADKDLKKFIFKRNPNIPGEIADKIVTEVVKHCSQKNLDPKLIIALMTVESNFNTNAISSVGAMGLGQLMPGTASDMGVNDAFSVTENIKGTISYLSILLNQFNGNLDLSLASYNMGPNAVQKSLDSKSEIPYAVKKYVSDIKYLKSKI